MSLCDNCSDILHKEVGSPGESRKDHRYLPNVTDPSSSADWIIYRKYCLPSVAVRILRIWYVHHDRERDVFVTRAAEQPF